MLTISTSDELAIAVTSAIHDGDAARLQALLDANPGLARGRIVDDKGVARTLLHVAADWPGHFPNAARTIAILAEAGAELDAVVRPFCAGGAEETPLHWAASSNDVAVIDALLDAGANMEAPGAIFTGGSPMSDAIIFAQWNAARRLLERGAKTTIWQAAALGLLDIVQHFVDREPKPSHHEITNALWHACRGGQLQAATYLVEQGANVHWIGHDKKTPLEVARESGAAELVEWANRQR